MIIGRYKQKSVVINQLTQGFEALYTIPSLFIPVNLIYHIYYTRN